MASPAVAASSPSELLAAGRRHLAVRDYSAAVESLAEACELLAKNHGETADECAEAYLWYGKALLGLSRDERGVLGEGMPEANAEEDDEDNVENEENDGNEEQEDNAEGENEDAAESKQEEDGPSTNEETKEAESTTKAEEPGSSEMEGESKPGTSNGDVNDESMVDLENEDDVDNLQLAWETLDLARSILLRRTENNPASRALLADVYLALGEVALESATYDKAVSDMGSCLEIQKELYRNDDRRIAETHYQIGLANSLASNYEDAITHFKNAANILQSRIKTLENPAAKEDATVKKHSTDPFYSVEGEIKELKELLPEIQEKIQDMMDYKAETIKRLRETLCPTNGRGPTESNGAGSSKAEAKPAASDISHLIKRKRKPEEETEEPAAKKVIT